MADFDVSFNGAAQDGRCCSQPKEYQRPLNVSIVFQPSLFSLDSGRELRQLRRMHFLPSDMQVNDKSLRSKYAEAGVYLNSKLTRAQLLAEEDNYEVNIKISSVLRKRVTD